MKLAAAVLAMLLVSGCARALIRPDWPGEHIRFIPAGTYMGLWTHPIERDGYWLSLKYLHDFFGVGTDD